MTSVTSTAPAPKKAVLPALGQYRLVAELSQGRMVNVYLATSAFNHLVVVKELRPELCDNGACVSRFLAEARLGAQLIHPNIVRTHEVRSEGRRHYVAMEFLDGRTLDRFGLSLTEHGRLSVGAHLRIIFDALRGLHHAHELGAEEGREIDVVHRDFGPRKVLVTFDGRTKVLHFGTAKTTPSSIHPATRVGRLAYVAPEQALDDHVDRRADVYAAGVMLWEAAAGRRLWPGLSDAEILAYAIQANPPSLRSVRPEVPADLEAICERAMAKDRGARYASAADLLTDLDEHLAHRTDTMTMREVGAVIGAAFAEERRKLKAVLHEALPVQSGRHANALVAFGAETGGPRRARREIVSVPPQRAATPTTFTGVADSSGGSGPPEVVSTNATLAALLSGALVVGALVFAVSRSGVPAPAPAPVSAALAPPPPTPRQQSEVAPPHVAVTLAVTPPLAQASIDDARIDERESAAPPTRTDSSPPSQAAHGAKRASAHVAPETAAAPSATATAIEVSPAGGRAPLRPIVTTNPYGSP